MACASEGPMYPNIGDLSVAGMSLGSEYKIYKMFTNASWRTVMKGYQTFLQELVYLFVFTVIYLGNKIFLFSSLQSKQNSRINS